METKIGELAVRRSLVIKARLYCSLEGGWDTTELEALRGLVET